MNKESNNHFDVIVIGVGSMGSSACYFLSKQGFDVLGLEQFQTPHENGSHFGQSRITRKAYFEHEDYVPLLKHSYKNLEVFEQETNSKLYYETGIVYFGQPNHPTMLGVKNSSQLYTVPVSRLSSQESRSRFPSFTIPGNFETLLEPEAGFLVPEKIIQSYVDQAIKNGATILPNETVLSWKEIGALIHVVTSRGEYTADKLIITAGSWTSKVLPSFPMTLKVTRQTLAWVTPKNTTDFTLGKFPCWFIEDPDLGMYYGFPALDPTKIPGPSGLKIASHRPGPEANPDRVDRTDFGTTAKDIQAILERYLPSVQGKVTTMKSCLYTYSGDENFIIDHLPGFGKRVTIACGFSGHGFKFVPLVGEVLADLAVRGETEIEVGFLRVRELKSGKLKA